MTLEPKTQLFLRRLKASTFGGLQKIDIEFKDSITRLIGVNGSGKTSILKAFVAAIKGISKKSEGKLIADRYTLLGNNPSSDLEVVLEDVKTKEQIVFKNHITRSGGNSLKIQSPEGYSISDEWVINLFNTSMVSPRYFAMLNPKDQAIALGVDTSEYDSEIENAVLERRAANVELKKYDSIEEVEEAVEVDVEELSDKIKNKKVELNQEFLINKAANKKLKEEYDANVKRIEGANKSIREALADAVDMKEEVKKMTLIVPNFPEDMAYVAINNYMSTLIEVPLPDEPSYKEEMPDSSDLDKLEEEMKNASATNIKASNYNRYLKSLKLKKEAQEDWDDADAEVERLRAEKIAFIQSYKFPFEALDVNDKGELTLDGRYINYENFSSGEMAVIVAQLHASLNPELKVMFIDDFELLDDGNKDKLLKVLEQDNWQVLLATVGSEKKGENSILIKEGKIVDNYEDVEKKSLI